MDTTRVLRRERVAIKSCTTEDCQFFRVRCDIANRDNLESLSQLIEQALREGRRTIVLSVTADSYLYSELIAHVVKCQSIVKRYGGTFCLVENDPGLRQVLDKIGLSRLVRVVASESAVLSGG